VEATGLVTPGHPSRPALAREQVGAAQRVRRQRLGGGVGGVGLARMLTGRGHDHGAHGAPRPGASEVADQEGLGGRAQDVAGAEGELAARGGLHPSAGGREGEAPGRHDLERLRQHGVRGPEPEEGVAAGELR
ncbi:hypothetical protein QU38_00470, partial [Staphylococcus aureus]